MAVVYGAIEGHGGAIQVDSEPGKGSTFSLTLPRSSQPAPTEAPSNPPAPTKFAGVRVLIAEDEEAVATVAKDLLVHLGCEVTRCADGREAARELDEGARRYDVVLLDHAMPHMTGAQVLHRIARLGSPTRSCRSPSR